MIEIDNLLFSDEIIENDFVCNLNKCKGACCVEGDAGAPLTIQEASIIEELLPLLENEMLPEALEVVNEKGAFEYDDEFDIVTPTIGSGICVYGYYDETNTVKCLIEKRYLEGKTDFKKPLSCHLYPIRVSESGEFTMINYEPRPDICAPACTLGKELSVPVYKFLKEPISRAFGEDVYNVLDDIAKEHFGK